MHKTLTTYLFCILTLGVLAQDPFDLESSDIGELIFSEKEGPVVQGKLIAYSASMFPELEVRYTISTLSFRKQTSKTAEIQPDGSFTLDLDYGIPYQEIWISVGDLYFGKILAFGTTVLELDLNMLSGNAVRYLGEGVAFTGTNSNINTFINGFENFKVERKEELIAEKLAIIMDNKMAKSEKVVNLDKVYKKLANIEASFAKKTDRSLQWILTNDRLATRYADIVSIHWGKKMNDILKQECFSFKPVILSNATVQYYDFLNFFLQIPNRIETKLLTERTLRDQLEESVSSEDLDKFLREYNKKRDNLRYDREVFAQGEESYLDRFEFELKSARLDMHLNKIESLDRTKGTIVSLLGQPKCISDRELYIRKIKDSACEDWAQKIMQKDLVLDKAVVSKINKALNSTMDSNSSSLGLLGENENEYLSDAESIEKLFASIKNHFHDKAVIVDLWAPWSDRCERDLERSKDISMAIDTLPVQMVYLCSSNDVAPEYWQKELRKIPIPGVHIYLNSKLSAEIMEYFKIRSFPNYFFIDQEGRFDPDFIVNLSEMKTKKLISKLNMETKI